MNPCFADSSYFIALLSKKDAHHEMATKLSKELRKDIVTTSWVLAETSASMNTVHTRQLFVGLVAYLRSDIYVTVLPPTAEAFDKGFELFGARLDKAWSMVDCISFITMQEFGIDDALTTDKHFAQAGFSVLMK